MEIIGNEEEKKTGTSGEAHTTTDNHDADWRHLRKKSGTGGSNKKRLWNTRVHESTMLPFEGDFKTCVPARNGEKKKGLRETIAGRKVTIIREKIVSTNEFVD
jgi:hypothetical protein